MRRVFLLILVLALGTLAWGIGGALQAPVLVRYRVALPGLTEPLRIVQLSDTHGGFDMPPRRLARVVARINALAPDIVVLTGDYIKGYPREWTVDEAADVVRPLGALRARLGVFAVLGNHDSAAFTRAGLRETRVKLLASSAADAGPLWIAGTADLLRTRLAIEGMLRTVAAIPAGKPVIVIAHEPEFFRWLPARAGLLIAGHTHGGQVVLPWLGTLSHGAFIDAHLRGVFREHGQVLVVSSGLGTSVVPVRVGVPPEVVEVTLVPG